MASNKHLQRMFNLGISLNYEEGALEHSLDRVLFNVEDGTVIDNDWKQMLLHIALMRKHLNRLEMESFKAMAESHFRWEP